MYAPISQAGRSLLNQLRAIEPDPRNLSGDAFRRAAQLIARQVTIEEPTPLDAESLAFPL